MTKSRAAPLKQIHIQMMEITAAMVAISISEIIEGSNIPSTDFLLDRQYVLTEIHLEGRGFKTFVANHVSATKDLHRHEDKRGN